jgi:hypothetical protein
MTVVMDKDKYDLKIDTHLNDASTYKKVTNNPMKNVSRKLN